MSNPRYQNGNLRRKYRARFKAMDAPCGICGGRFGPIRYDQKSCAENPLSFVIDEKIPISKYREGGYESRAAAARDWNNLQAAHYACNAAKGSKLIEASSGISRIKNKNVSDGAW
jgi:5-methylcytosine-specific restriction endonuclease McrA